MKAKNNLQIKGLKRCHPLQGFNSWKVGGSADFFYQPENQEDIFYSLQWARGKKLPVAVLGKGTNVLISDKGVEGLLIGLTKLQACREWEEKGRLHIIAQTGVSKAKIMQIFLQHKLAPALFLCGLPGDVGGGVVMNAGVGQGIFPREFKDIVDWVKVIREDKIVLIHSGDMKWKYRFSEGWEPGLIYEVGMSWPMNPVPDLPVRLREMALKRSQSQPLQFASCGSVFKNPLTGEKSGALIEKCGLKGHRIGQAGVSKKHANFIINLGTATAMDIHQLIEYVRETVRRKSQVLLEPEVRYLGRWS